MPQRVLILGAAGKDFHVFNTLYRGRDDCHVVAFTATQIPGIDGRRYPAGLAGHSDGDALVHAVIDAILGAMGEGDIGQLFPADPKTQGTDSMTYLADVKRRLDAGGWRVVNIDTVIVTELPKIAPYAAAMKAALCPVLGIPAPALGIKGKTNEGLGPVGEGQAIACWATALLER